MPFYRWDEMTPRNLVKTTDSEGNIILGEYTTLTRQIQPPGKETRPHTHGCEQMIHILEGEAWFRVGDEEKPSAPGTSCTSPSASSTSRKTPAPGASSISPSRTARRTGPRPKYRESLRH